MSLTREECDYASCYCEENIYRLAQRLSSSVSIDSLNVVLISNPNKSVPLFSQKAALRLHGGGQAPVFWDYHVILLEKRGEKWVVWDLDSTLSFPCTASDYYKGTMRPDVSFGPAYKRLFRVIPASVFLSTFSSDRSHMLTEEGTYTMKPPKWPAIWRGTNSLQEMIDMQRNGLPGHSIHPEESFLQEFCS